MILPVSGKTLSARDVQLRDVTLPECRILPVFDHRGRVRLVMVVSPGSREWWLVEWRRRLAWVPFFRPARLDIRRTHRSRFGRFEEALWYHCLQSDDAAAIATKALDGVAANCAGLLPKGVIQVFFRRSLARLTMVGTWKSGSYELGKWKPDWLPGERPTVPQPPPRRASGWVLEPLWPVSRR